MNSRDLIIICLTIIILLFIGIFMLSNSGHGETTILNMTSPTVFNEGESLIFKLSDENGTAISNAKIGINLTDSKGITENFTLKTNSNGECRLEDMIVGNFSFIAKYDGNRDFKESSTKGTITVNKKAATNNKSTSNSQSYKSDYKVDDVIDGWDPSEHEVSREDIGDGNVRINYDDGYFRIVDSDGNILNYGY